MLQPVFCPVAGVLQGGIWMPAHSSSAEAQITPAQVWSALSDDLRTRVLALLAQLALYIVVARPAAEGNSEERSRAGSTCHH